MILFVLTQRFILIRYIYKNYIPAKQHLRLNDKYVCDLLTKLKNETKIECLIKNYANQ